MGMLCSDGLNDQDPLAVGMGGIPEQWMGRISEQNQGSVRKRAVDVG